MDIFFAIGPVLIPLIIYGLLSIVGAMLERRHEADLTTREAAVAGFYLSDLRNDPSATNAQAGELVSASVVMGTGYLKQFTAGFKTLVGGEIKGYQRVLNNARREAQLRLIEQAASRGATGIINVRFETADVGGVKPFSEVLCYGTMIR